MCMIEMDVSVSAQLASMVLACFDKCSLLFMSILRNMVVRHGLANANPSFSHN